MKLRSLPKYALPALVLVTSLAHAQSSLFEVELLYEVNGDSPSDLLGGSAEGVGDLDGDGYADFAVGVQRDDPNAVGNAGSVYVFSGKNLALLYIFGGSTPNAFFGHEVRAAGDVDADGVPDIVVAALLDDPGGVVDAGSVTVFSGQDGGVLHRFDGTTPDGWLGRSCDGAGDVDGDGHDDILVGSTDSPNGPNSGSVRVFSGADGALLYTFHGGAGDALGVAVAGVGDLNGDGFDDFAAGARGTDVNGANSGTVTVWSGLDGSVLYAFHGNAGMRLAVVNDAGDVDADGVPDIVMGDAANAYVVSGSDGAILHVLQGTLGEEFARWVAGAGDIDRDGHGDILVGAPLSDAGGPASGRVLLYSGADGSVLFSLVGDPGDQLGSAVGRLGDVNGDLFEDFVVGAFFDDNTFTDAGSAKIFIFSGAATIPDTSPPAVSFDGPADGQIFGTHAAAVTATVTDESETEVVSTPAGIAVSLPAGGGAVTGSLPLDVEGQNTIVLSATDSAGNVGGSSVSVIRDTLPPVIALLSPSTGAVVGESPVTVGFSVTDATPTAVAVPAASSLVASGGGEWSATVELVEGDNVVVVTATDAAGNPSQLSFTLTLDLSAPVIAIDSPADQSTFGPGSETVAVTATVDDLTATVVTTDVTGMATALPSGGGVLTGTFSLAEGWNRIWVEATDEVGHGSSAEVSVLFDTTPPGLTLTSPAPGTYVRGTIDVTATAVDSLPGTGVAEVEFRVDGVPMATLTSAPWETLLDTSALGDGAHTIQAVAVDRQGNTRSRSVAFFVDNAAPAAAIVDPSAAAFVSGVMPIGVQASDALAGVARISVRVGGISPTVDPSASFSPGLGSAFVSGSHDTHALPDGALIVTAHVVDAAGNETLVQIQVTVDNTAPEKFLIAPSDGAVVSGMLDVVVDGADANLDRIDLYVDRVLVASSTQAPFTNTLDTTTRLDGMMTITVVVYDLAGNVSNCTAKVTVDNMHLRLTPEVLNLKSKGNGVVMVHMQGAGLGQLLPTEDQCLELVVPGGSPVAVESGWSGDDSLHADGGLNLRFARPALVSALQAGIAAGAIDAGQLVPVTLRAGRFVLGSTLVRVEN